jgi:hypothetical protein
LDGFLDPTFYLRGRGAKEAVPRGGHAAQQIGDDADGYILLLADV